MSETIVRLHISPFSPDLLPVILGSSSNKSAQNISYHTLQTFPEKSYGYVDLPSMEAEKVKKKLNGAILKGQKVKIEEAHPKKRRHGGENAGSEAVAEDEAIPRRSKRAKKEHDVLSGHELSPDRKVKRGWTEPKVEKVKHKKKDSKEKKKQQASSKFTEKEELLFKTKIPKNKKSSSSKSAKKEKDKSGTDVVHEFENSTTVPSFLRDSKVSTSKTALEYKDGEGWVDESGEVVEQESNGVSQKRRKVKSEERVKNPSKKTKRKVEPEPPSPPTSRTDSSTSDDDDEDEDDDPVLPSAADDETSSSGSSDGDESSSLESEDTGELAAAVQKPSINTTAPSATATPTPDQEIHPLEALFKKPKLPTPTPAPVTSSSTPKPGTASRRPTLELDTKFTFFGSPTQTGDADDNAASDIDENDDIGVKHNLLTIPMTPFSSQDYRSRTLRSAAPTPDTAMPGRSHDFTFSLSKLSSSPSPTSSSSSPPPQQKQQQTSKYTSTAQDDNKPTDSITGQQDMDNITGNDVPKSDFEKQFWEKRGENNRAWKARRRAVLKENRQRENRARRPKAW